MEVERILDNKPVRPPMISTLAMRWQSAAACPSAIGSVVMPDDVSIAEEEKDAEAKQNFCELQWQWQVDIVSLENQNMNKQKKSNNASTQQDHHTIYEVIIAAGSDGTVVKEGTSSTAVKGGVGGSSNKMKRNTSSLSFKSLDFSIKNFIMRKGHQDNYGAASSGGGAPKDTKVVEKKTMPYLKIDTVTDGDEGEEFFKKSSQNSLLHPSPNKSSTNSPFLSIDDDRSSSVIRRSSTSDIVDSPASGSNNNSRRPSTSSLLRKARERKGTESQQHIGRSISQGLTRPGGGGGGQRGAAQRRLSMAY